MVNTGSLSCTGVTNMVSSPTCTFDSTNQVLTVSHGFSAAVAGGSTITFQINTIKNPINT